jgi:hypothetical protein
VVSAVAWQDSPVDSSGPVDWNQNVHIRVVSDVFGAGRTVEGEYRFVQPNNPYWRLFAATNLVTYSGANGTLRAQGGAWHRVQSAADSAWIRSLERNSSVALTHLPTTSPLAAPFIAAHFPASPTSPDTATRSWDHSNPQNPRPGDYITMTLEMDAGPGPSAYRYFRAETDMWSLARAPLPLYDFYSSGNITVKVRGTAVWIVPAGMLLDGELHVERLPGAATATLIIVAGPSVRAGPNAIYGVTFGKAIRTPNDDANVFVVSEATVRVQDGSLANTPPVIACRNLCIYANAIQLSGPAAGTHVLSLNYRPDFKQVADDLYGRGLLPSPSGVQMTSFTFVPGSWRESAGLQ